MEFAGLKSSDPGSGSLHQELHSLKPQNTDEPDPQTEEEV
jgi:hypothetical protein